MDLETPLGERDSSPPPVAFPTQSGTLNDDSALQGAFVDLRLVARRQRQLLWIVLAGLLTYFFAILMFASSIQLWAIIATNALFIILTIVSVVMAIYMLHALRTSVAVMIICGILLFAPCINLITLLVVNGMATKALRRAGLRVGFMGVKDEDAVRAMNPWLCRGCGYNLFGNTSGRCPECGCTVTGLPVTNPASVNAQS